MEIMSEIQEKSYPYTFLLNGKEIDTVFYSSKMDTEEVKRDLIDHDGYDPSIEVVLEKEESNEFILQEELTLEDIVLEKGDKIKVTPRK
jgi:hypothetical protein